MSKLRALMLVDRYICTLRRLRLIYAYCRRFVLGVIVGQDHTIIRCL